MRVNWIYLYWCQCDFIKIIYFIPNNSLPNVQRKFIVTKSLESKLDLVINFRSRANPSSSMQQGIKLIFLADWLFALFYGVSTLFGPFHTELSRLDKSFKQMSFV